MLVVLASLINGWLTELGLLRVWRPATVLGFGGRELTPAEAAAPAELGAGPGKRDA